MTMESQTLYESTPTERLLETWASLKSVSQTLADDMRLIEGIVTRRMISDKATVVLHHEVECAMRTSVTYLSERLTPLLELVPADKLEGYTPAHKETTDVPASWNMTKIKTLAKLGGKVKETIESARVESISGLSIKLKPKVNVPPPVVHPLAGPEPDGYVEPTREQLSGPVNEELPF